MYEPVSDGRVNWRYSDGSGRARDYGEQWSDDGEEDCCSCGDGTSASGARDQHRHKSTTVAAPAATVDKNTTRHHKRSSSTATKRSPDICSCCRNDDGRGVATMRTSGSSGGGCCPDSLVDVDHIALETERNCKQRLCSVGVQTSPFLPYRLRFWPKCGAHLECNPEDSSTTFSDRVRCCGRTLSQWFFSQLGLTVVLFNWALLGAAAFYKTEGPREQQQAETLDSVQKELAIDLASSLHQVAQFSQLWPETILKHLSQHETLILDAVSAGYGEGGRGFIWTYPGCILFAVSLLTTLGFGAPVPRTALGRGAAVVFSAVGIPLHFLLILNAGNLAAGKLQYVLGEKEAQSTIPTNDALSNGNKPVLRRQSSWVLKWFPLISILFYYVLGTVLFGFVRQRSIVDSVMFPLDFTAAGGVAKTSGHVRIFYALYLETAVILAATIVSLLQASATRGVVDIGLRLGLLTNT